MQREEIRSGWKEDSWVEGKDSVRVLRCRRGRKGQIEHWSINAGGAELEKVTVLKGWEFPGESET